MRNQSVVVVGGRKRDLYIMDYDGFNTGQLSAHNALVMSPNCSRDGRKVVYNSDKVWDQDLYVMDLVPRVRDTKISSTFSLEQSAEWSPDGSRLVFSSNGDIYTSNAAGKNLKRLTKGYSIDVSPTWSPDGRQIAFGRNDLPPDRREGLGDETCHALTFLLQSSNRRVHEICVFLRAVSVVTFERASVVIRDFDQLDPISLTDLGWIKKK